MEKVATSHEIDTRLVRERLLEKIGSQKTGTILFSAFDVSKINTDGFIEELINELFGDRGDLPLLLLAVEKESLGQIKLASPTPTRIKQDFRLNGEIETRIFDSYKLTFDFSKRIVIDKSATHIFYLDNQNIVQHYIKGSLKKNHVVQDRPNSYYSLLRILLEKYPDGCKSAPIKKIFGSKTKFQTLVNTIGKNQNGLWRAVGLSNAHPENKEGKIIYINAKNEVTFCNLINSSE